MKPLRLEVALISIAVLLSGGHGIFFVLMGRCKDLEEILTCTPNENYDPPVCRVSAPARRLNRVAATTRLFFGSTALTATSGVSTIATNLGGAVNIVARL